MGLYATIRVDQREGQVKIWHYDETMDGLPTLHVGSEVPPHDGHPTYSIAMREGGFVNVDGCLIASWTEEPSNDCVFDKWGASFDGICRNPIMAAVAEITGEQVTENYWGSNG